MVICASGLPFRISCRRSGIVDLSGHGASVVRGDDRNGFAALGENRSSAVSCGFSSAYFDGFLRSQRWPVRGQIRFDDSLNTGFWKNCSLSCFSIWKRVGFVHKALCRCVCRMYFLCNDTEESV